MVSKDLDLWNTLADGVWFSKIGLARMTGPIQGGCLSHFQKLISSLGFPRISNDLFMPYSLALILCDLRTDSKYRQVVGISQVIRNPFPDGRLPGGRIR